MDENNKLQPTTDENQPTQNVRVKIPLIVHLIGILVGVISAYLVFIGLSILELCVGNGNKLPEAMYVVSMIFFFFLMWVGVLIHYTEAQKHDMKWMKQSALQGILFGTGISCFGFAVFCLIISAFALAAVFAILGVFILGILVKHVEDTKKRS